MGPLRSSKKRQQANRARWGVKEISWLIINPKSDQLQLPEGGTGALCTSLIHAPNAFGAI
jgi:hypothetical protein